MRKLVKPLAVAALALGLIGLGVWQLEAVRAPLAISTLNVGATPVTLYHPREGDHTHLVIVTHGFAGSRPLMASYSLALAHAGYTVAAFDFEGHGRNPVPMSGDVDAIEGTTRRLVEETQRVTEAMIERLDGPQEVALLGHSMATDIIVRAAQDDTRVRALVAIAPFSGAVTPTHPRNLLMITGAWEGRLRAFGLQAVQQVQAQAGENETVTSPDGRITRRSTIIANAEHVGVLYTRSGIEQAVAWIDAAFARASDAPVPNRLVWINLTLTGTILLAWPLAQCLPARTTTPHPLSRRRFAAALGLPALAAPVLALIVPTRFLPVLVADYLLVHMALYGFLQLAILRFAGLRPAPFALAVGLALAVYGVGVFGLALDRYVASFVPHAARIPIIAALAVGAIPFMLADAAMANAHAKLWERALVRLAFLLSLAIAIALDFQGLFFLLLIIPVIALFFLVFGLMGRWVGRRSGPLASGLGLGCLLAWSLGVTFPLFV